MTTTEAKIAQVKKAIDKSVEPRIARVIKEFNESLKKIGMRVGAEVQWYIEEATDETKTG